MEPAFTRIQLGRANFCNIYHHSHRSAQRRSANHDKTLLLLQTVHEMTKWNLQGCQANPAMADHANEGDDRQHVDVGSSATSDGPNVSGLLYFESKYRWN